MYSWSTSILFYVHGVSVWALLRTIASGQPIVPMYTFFFFFFFFSVFNLFSGDKIVFLLDQIHLIFLLLNLKGNLMLTRNPRASICSP